MIISVRLIDYQTSFFTSIKNTVHVHAIAIYLRMPRYCDLFTNAFFKNVHSYQFLLLMYLGLIDPAIGGHKSVNR